MSLNKNDRAQIEKTAQSNGMSWNSAGTKLTDGKNEFGFSGSGGSGSYNGGFINSVHDFNEKFKKSKR